MKRFQKIRFFAVLLLFFILCGCAVEGTVTTNDSPLPGVTLALDSDPPQTAITDANGNYVFGAVDEGRYTITPSLAGYVFSPPQRGITLTAAPIMDLDFRAVENKTVTGKALALDDPEALIITDAAFADAFEPFAVLHTLTGIHTEVVSIETICEDGCEDNDTAKAIKAYLMNRDNLKYLVLGGDVEVVPSREVTDSFSFTFIVPGFQAYQYSYQEIFFTDYYYADFAEWDLNRNGIYGEPWEMFTDYRPEIAVSRIPASTPAEISAYFDKVVRYMTDYDPDRMTKALLQAGVFTYFFNPFEEILEEVSGAFYDTHPGRTEDAIVPFDVTRQYEEADLLPDKAAYIYSNPQEFSADHKQLLDEGYNIVRYSNHGDMYTLAPGFYNTEIDNMTNRTLPIMLSGICSSGEFGEIDAAAERAINAPNGGAIVFIGQATIGNSLLGSMQLLDETIRYMVTEKHPVLADACFYAHDTLISVNPWFYFPLSKSGLPFVFDQIRKVITPKNYGYTQLSSVVLGDILIPVWNETLERAPEIGISTETVSGGITLTLTPESPLTRSPRVYADGSYYGFESAANVYEITIRPAPSKIRVGASAADSQFLYRTVP